MHLLQWWWLIGLVDQSAVTRQSDEGYSIHSLSIYTWPNTTSLVTSKRIVIGQGTKVYHVYRQTAIVEINIDILCEWCTKPQFVCSANKTCVSEAGIKSREMSLHPTVSVWCNYLSVPLIPAPGAQVLICHRHGWYHDDVIEWKHFPRYWPFVRGIHRSPVNSPQKGQWRGALMFTLICTRINGWVNNREAGDLRRYRAHYDVIVMSI